MSNITTKEKLFTSSYICAWMANFLLFFSFYLIMPLLALYLIQKFSVEESVVGAVLSCYTLACLFIRPFSGYLVDAFPRKKLYLLALFFFVSLFLGYPLVSTVFLFAVLRILHGFAFGMVSISSNTIIDCDMLGVKHNTWNRRYNRQLNTRFVNVLNKAVSK
jgi:MFS family permease